MRLNELNTDDVDPSREHSQNTELYAKNSDIIRQLNCIIASKVDPVCGDGLSQLTNL